MLNGIIVGFVWISGIIVGILLWVSSGFRIFNWDNSNKISVASSLDVSYDVTCPFLGRLKPARNDHPKDHLKKPKIC